MVSARGHTPQRWQWSPRTITAQLEGKTKHPKACDPVHTLPALPPPHATPSPSRPLRAPAIPLRQHLARLPQGHGFLSACRRQPAPASGAAGPAPRPAASTRLPQHMHSRGGAQDLALVSWGTPISRHTRKQRHVSQRRGWLGTVSAVFLTHITQSVVPWRPAPRVALRAWGPKPSSNTSRTRN